MKKVKDIRENLEDNLKAIIRMKSGGSYPVGDAFGLFEKNNKDLLDGYEVVTHEEWTSFGKQSRIEVKRK
jgi:hypothetical protein